MLLLFCGMSLSGRRGSCWWLQGHAKSHEVACFGQMCIFVPGSCRYSVLLSALLEIWRRNCPQWSDIFQRF